QGGPAGILRPGQRESITFYSYSDTEPGEYTVSVDRVIKDLAAPFDWESLRPSLIPAAMGETELQSILAEIRQNHGSTGGDYLAMLSRNATLTGSDPRNPSELFDLEFAKTWASRGASIIGRVEGAWTNGGTIFVQPTDGS